MEQEFREYDKSVKYEFESIYSAILKAAGRRSSRLEPPPGAIPAAGSIHGLWEFQEFVPYKIMERPGTVRPAAL